MGFRNYLHEIKPISPYQFGIFRIIFGLYLCVHFGTLFPYASELFSRAGVFAGPEFNRTYGLFPNILAWFPSPTFATVFVGLLLIASVGLMLGYRRIFLSLVLWYGWACLFNSNNLISNPSLPYIGLLFLLCALIPDGEALRWESLKPERAWFFPKTIYDGAWALLALGYSFSGVLKLQSPSWVDGTALLHLSTNPLARSGWTNDLFLALPSAALRMNTWLSLVLEIVYLPLAYWKRTRPWIWLALIGMHLGILTLVNFSDLTLGMLMIHLFTFDPEWLAARKGLQRAWVFYDGICGVCNATIQFLLAEDRARILKFAPLQGQTAVAEKLSVGPEETPTSLMYLKTENDRVVVLSQSSAVLGILNDIGGLWRVVSWFRIVPPALRDPVYRWVARNRYRWFGKLETCAIPSPDEKARFLP